MNINLVESFNDTVNLYPNKLALVDENAELSFNELQSYAKKIASNIYQKTESINRPIAVLLPKINDTIASFIGILYSGNCYAPLDVNNPIARLESILDSLNPICIVTNNNYIQKLEKCNYNADVINLDALDLTIDINFNYRKCIDTDPAYIIHTSGSTGAPKGVVISHRSIFDHINWVIDTFQITENERIANQANFVFDNSTLDIYLMAFKGASLHIVPEKMFMFPIKLLEYINKNKINFIYWVPTILVNVANLKPFDAIQLPSLKKVLFCGEVMPTKHINYWINNLKGDILYANLYGPTETTVNSSYYIIDRNFQDDEVLPIGKSCRNTDIIILNEENKACGINEKGELCIRGSSLALGYWNNPEKTNASFIQNPLNKVVPERIYKTGDLAFFNENNEIIFVGRKDFQIKLFGYRIELGEIEHSILSVFDSINACVLFDELKNEIVLFYESQIEIPSNEFRIKLVTVLFKYMIPTRYIKIEKFPKTASGKIDRVSLKNLLK